MGTKTNCSNEYKKAEYKKTESPVNTTIQGPDVSAIISAETIIQ